MKKKVICLISGGIDSPVAAYKMMKAGYRVVLVHFHNLTHMSDNVKEKIFELRDILQRYQKKIKLYMVLFGPLQREIIKFVPGKKRMLVYRRFMFFIAEKIAKMERATGLVTGDSLAQVASQTLDNLYVIYAATKKKVYHPLIGLDKSEIIAIAKQIGTYNVSIRPYEDCCSFLVSDHPETHANLNEIEKMEKRLNKEKLIKDAIRGLKLYKS